MDAHQQRVRAVETACPRQIGVQEFALQGHQHHIAGGAFHLDVAEAVVGESGLPGLLAAALEGVGERDLITRAGVGAVLRDQAILVQQLAGKQLDLAAGGSAHHDFRPAGEVFTEVVDENPRARLGDRQRCQGSRHDDGGCVLSPERSSRSADLQSCGPVVTAVARRGLIPTSGLQARIEILSAISLGENDGSRSRPPRRIADEQLLAAVREAQSELQNELWLAV